MFSEEFITVSGKSSGFESRGCSDCLEINAYCGTRGPKCVRPSSIMSESIISSFQYYRAVWVLNTMQLIQKTVNKLTFNAMKYRYSLDYFHEILIDLCYKLKSSSLINSKVL